MSDKSVALRAPKVEILSFDDEKKELIRKTVARGLKEQEFQLFLAIASARGLDPILNQIHGVMRKVGDKESLVIQIGIDGFRLIASRTGELAGTDEPEFEYNDKKEVVKAKITVYRLIGGKKCKFVGIAYWDEFYPGDKQGFMWNKMPHNQLAKCAEAQALRKGFPGDLGSMYIPEELERQEIDVTPPKEEPLAIEGDQRTKELKELFAKFKKLGVTESEINKKFGVEIPLDLTDDQVVELNRIGADILNKRTTAAEVFGKSEVKF